MKTNKKKGLFSFSVAIRSFPNLLSLLGRVTQSWYILHFAKCHLSSSSGQPGQKSLIYLDLFSI